MVRKLNRGVDLRINRFRELKSYDLDEPNNEMEKPQAESIDSIELSFENKLEYSARENNYRFGKTCLMFYFFYIFIIRIFLLFLSYGIEIGKLII